MLDFAPAAFTAGVAESADAQDLKSCTVKGVRVQVPPPAPKCQRFSSTTGPICVPPNSLQPCECENSSRRIHFRTNRRMLIHALSRVPGSFLPANSGCPLFPVSENSLGEIVRSPQPRPIRQRRSDRRVFVKSVSRVACRASKL